jgi:hypothetical protein
LRGAANKENHSLKGPPILKAGQSQLADFESRQEPILPVFKSFSQI